MLIPIISPAITVNDVSQPSLLLGNRAVDDAEVLSLSTEDQLNQLISRAARLGVQTVTVVTVEALAPDQSASKFATDLLYAWDWLGTTSEQNDDVLLLIVEQSRQAEIAIGRGAIEAFTPTQAAQIMETQILPPLSQGNFDQAAIAGTRSIIQAMYNGWMPFWLLALLELWHPVYLWVLLSLAGSLWLTRDGYQTLWLLSQRQSPGLALSDSTKLQLKYSITYQLSHKIVARAMRKATPLQKKYRRYWAKGKIRMDTALNKILLNEQDWVGILTLTSLFYTVLLLTGIATLGIAFSFIGISTGLFAATVRLIWKPVHYQPQRSSIFWFGISTAVIIWVILLLYMRCSAQYPDSPIAATTIVGHLSMAGIPIYLFVAPIIITGLMSPILNLCVDSSVKREPDSNTDLVYLLHNLKLAIATYRVS